MKQLNPEDDFNSRLEEVLDCELFKTLSEPVRCRILRILATEGPLDVGGVAARFEQDRSVISRHLALMADAGVLLTEKQARSRMYYMNGSGFLEKLEKMTETVRYLLLCRCDALGKG